MQGGQYQNVEGQHMNNMWMSIAQAYLKTTDNPASLPLFQEAGTHTSNVSPIPGLYSPV
jgi:hypothetical protein